MKYATELREAAKNAILDKEELKPLFEQMEAAAARGERFVNIDLLTEDVCIALRAIGYTVEFGVNGRGETSQVVGWLE